MWQFMRGCHWFRVSLWGSFILRVTIRIGLRGRELSCYWIELRCDWLTCSRDRYTHRKRILRIGCRGSGDVFIENDMDALLNSLGPFFENLICFACGRIAKEYSFITSGIKFSKVIVAIVVNKAVRPKDSEMSDTWRATSKQFIGCLV